MTNKKNTKKRQIRITAKTHVLDLEEFNKLTDILFETYKEKHATCARMLGISTRTWRSWETKPPTWPWWNLVLRHLLQISISHIEGNRGFSKEHKDKLRNALGELSHTDPLLDYIEDQSYNIAASVQHLRQLLMKKGRYKDEIFTTAKMGGFSRKTLERASKTLEVVKTQEGYGSHKRSYWRLPNEDDD